MESFVLKNFLSAKYILILYRLSDILLKVKGLNTHNLDSPLKYSTSKVSSTRHKNYPQVLLIYVV